MPDSTSTLPDIIIVKTYLTSTIDSGNQADFFSVDSLFLRYFTIIHPFKKTKMARRSFFQSSNPFMRETTYQRTSQDILDRSVGERMTIRGAISKTFILATIMLLTTGIGFAFPSSILLWGGVIGAFIIVLILSFRPQWSPSLAPVYAALEGLFLGTISYIYAAAFEGIVFQAFSLTIAALFAMLFIYQSGIIKVTGRFRMMIVMATGAIAVVYLLTFILSRFGISMPYLHDGGTFGMVISAVILAIACLNLLLDFDNFEMGERYGAPAYMEWFSAMGLLITLVWIYLEILRLLSRLRK